MGRDRSAAEVTGELVAGLRHRVTVVHRSPDLQRVVGTLAQHPEVLQLKRNGRAASVRLQSAPRPAAMDEKRPGGIDLQGLVPHFHVEALVQFAEPFFDGPGTDDGRLGGEQKNRVIRHELEQLVQVLLGRDPIQSDQKTAHSDQVVARRTGETATAGVAGHGQGAEEERQGDQRSGGHGHPS